MDFNRYRKKSKIHQIVTHSVLIRIPLKVNRVILICTNTKYDLLFKFQPLDDIVHKAAAGMLENRLHFQKDDLTCY